MKIEKYYENPSALHINTEDDRAYFIPYAKEKNDRMILLSGNDWKFQWYSDYLKIPESAKDGILDQYDVIDVPSCVNMLGYENHQYANVRMPIPFDPPFVPRENPCGIYVKEFKIDTLSEKIYLDFEGVDSCYYVWVNGKFCGYSQVSHCTSEFDVTDLIKTGTNVLSVLVMKWCDGTYFEDQDKLRMSGIFRDVYLLMDEQAASVELGCQGLLFHPYLLGERCPYFNPNARGDFFGVSMIHKKGHFARALLEGVAFSLYDCLQVLKEFTDNMEDIVIIGGGAKSPLWCQIVSDIFGLEVKMPQNAESSFGGALLAGVGVGAFADELEAAGKCIRMKKTYYPDMENHKKYMELFEIYKEIADMSGSVWKKLAEFSA